MQAIILAGGLGSRLRSVVSDVPKPMAPIAGRPFLEYQMLYWEQQGVSRFILSVGYLYQKIESFFGKHFGKAEIEYCIESEPLGTGGALILASRKLDPGSQCVVLNGDTFLPVPLNPLLTFHQNNEAELTLSVLSRKTEDRYGLVFVQSNGAINSMGEKPKGGDTYINGGVYVFGKKLLTELVNCSPRVCSLEKDLFPGWQSGGKKLFAFVSEADFLDIGTPDDYQRAESFIRVYLKTRSVAGAR